MKALSETEVLAALQSLPGWQYVDNAIERVYEGRTYPVSLDLLYRIGQLAEQENHHPDLLLHYRKLTIRYWTHTAQGVTALDLEQARKAERVIRESLG